MIPTEFPTMSIYREPRRPIQIAFAPRGHWVALCNDGSIWTSSIWTRSWDQITWSRQPDIPQDEVPAPSLECEEVYGCQRIKGHEGFHTATKDIAEREDART